MDSVAPRVELSKCLVGAGVEVGAGHWPFPVPDAVTAVTFVSRHTPEEERRLFPEVPPEHDFGRVDVLADLDRDGLSAFRDSSLDFVIASHVIEHLAAPIWGLSEMVRVVRPGGYVVLVLPDRRFTFDKERDGTPVEHLIREHKAGVREIDDLHIREFLTKTGGPASPTDEELTLHRARSVHAHCWTDAEFAAFLVAIRDEFGLPFSLTDCYDAGAAGGTGLEFAFLLKVERLPRDVHDSVTPPLASLGAVAAENEALRAELERVYASRTWRLGAIPRSLLGGVRSLRS